MLLLLKQRHSAKLYTPREAKAQVVAAEAGWPASVASVAWMERSWRSAIQVRAPGCIRRNTLTLLRPTRAGHTWTPCHN